MNHSSTLAAPALDLSNCVLDERLVVLQRDILALVATLNDYEHHLSELCLAAEEMLPNAVASIMLYDEEVEGLTVRCAPSIPEIAVEQLNGLAPGPQAGSCGTAVYCKSPVYVENTGNDIRWANLKQFALDFNILACWSQPIIMANGDVVGSFALSSFEKRAPNDFQKALLSVCAHLSGIVLYREQMEKRLWNQAHYDLLTKLPNRALLSQRLDHAIDKSQRTDYKIAVLFIDVDNFKMINDSYGYNVGDEVLCKIAETMKACVRDEDTVARTGGDEFVVLIEEIDKPMDAGKIAQKIIHHARDIKHFDNNHVTLSIGISLYPDDAGSVDRLLRNADTAMYAAKALGKNNCYFYKRELTEAIQQQTTIGNELRHALNNNELTLYFQPIYDKLGQKIESAEALIRWNHPQKGLQMPTDFIPVAEEIGLINEISEWVLFNACAMAKKWLEQGIDFKQIAINLSAADIARNCFDKVDQALRVTGLPAQKLALEITETMLMKENAAAVKELTKIRELGVTIALDDFGTGYSSLHQLRRLPIDKLKIDRSFIMELPDNQDDVNLTRLIISMGKSLSLKVVAEGVETEQQRQFLDDENCDQLQGYFFSKPLAEDAFLQLLAGERL